MAREGRLGRLPCNQNLQESVFLLEAGHEVLSAEGMLEQQQQEQQAAASSKQ